MSVLGEGGPRKHPSRNADCDVEEYRIPLAQFLVHPQERYSAESEASEETRGDISSGRASTTFIDHKCDDPACLTDWYGKDMGLSHSLTSNCNLETDVDEYEESQEMNVHFLQHRRKRTAIIRLSRYRLAFPTLVAVDAAGRFGSSC